MPMSSRSGDSQEAVKRHNREIQELREELRVLKDGQAKKALQAEIDRRIAELEADIKLQELQEVMAKERQRKRRRRSEVGFGSGDGSEATRPARGTVWDEPFKRTRLPGLPHQLGAGSAEPRADGLRGQEPAGAGISIRIHTEVRLANP
jgi:hypothetical protein